MLAKVLLRQKIRDTEYVLRRLTFPPGGSTGWHYHDGVVRALVVRGTATHFESACRTDGEYRPGGVIHEPPGYVHVCRNLADVPLVMVVLYALPHGAPFSREVPDPGCGFE